MVRALARDPRQLDDIDRLVRDLARTEEGRALLPDDWDTIWEPIWAAREELRSMSEYFDPEPGAGWAQGLPAPDRRVRLRAALRTVSHEALPGRRRGRPGQDARRARCHRQGHRAPPRGGRRAHRRRLRLLERRHRPPEHQPAQRHRPAGVQPPDPAHAAAAAPAPDQGPGPQLRLVHAGHDVRPQVPRRGRAGTCPPLPAAPATPGASAASATVASSDCCRGPRGWTTSWGSCSARPTASATRRA